MPPYRAQREVSRVRRKNRIRFSQTSNMAANRLVAKSAVY